MLRLGGLAALVVVLLACASPARADREFSPRFSAAATGDIAMAANVLLSCRGTDAGCAMAQAAAKGASVGNNDWDMRPVDVDADPATFDSSSATLALPAGASVLFAGLYWGANTSRGTRGAPAPDVAARGRARLTPPGAAAVAVTADRVDDGSARSQAGAYQAFADVTATVRAAGPGTYTLADVQTGAGLDRYAGWALVVAYSAPGAPSRDLSVFDGFLAVNDGDAPHELSVSGFRTPRSGPVRTRVGFVAYEGDRSQGGDGAAFNGTPLGDAASPANNFFNSTITLPGGVARTPEYANQLGYDADMLDTSGLLANGATSAVVKLQTTGDTYLPGVIFLATDLFSPDVQLAKSVTDVNGGVVEPGDELAYTISGTNRGQDAALSTTVVDAVPAGTDFVAGSLSVGGGARTDVRDGDGSDFDGGAGQVTFRVGLGASATAGGRLAPGESFSARYRVRVAADAHAGTEVVNRARVSLLAETLGFPVETQTNETRLTVVAPDLSIGKAFVGINAPGQVVNYVFTVTNVGNAPSQGTVTVTDPIPAGIQTTAVSGNGWTCDPPEPVVRCTRSDPLAPGAAYPPVVSTNTILVLPPPVTGFVNTSTVSGGADTNLSNNSATAAPPAAPLAPLALDKAVAPDRVAPGDTVAYLLTVKNTGFQPNAGVQLTDSLPTGLTLVSAEPLDQGSCSGALTCALGTLGTGASARVRVTATVGATTAPGALANSASVSATDPDPFPDDNTASATVEVRTTARTPAAEDPADAPKAGEPVSWTATVDNAGPHDIPGGTFADEVPAAVERPSASVPGGTCTAAGRLVSCALPAIPAGGSAVVTITGTLADDAGAAQLKDGVQVVPLAYTPPPIPTAVSPPAPIVRTAGDVGVVKVGTPDPAARGGEITYHLRATNHGPSTATNVVVRDRLPSGARLIRAVGARCTAGRRSVRCPVGRIAANRSVTFDLVVRLGRGGFSRNAASIAAKQPDPAGANDRDRSTAGLVPRIELSNAPGRRSAGLGETLNYTFTIHNAGPGTARSVVVCDRPGPGLRLSRAGGAHRSGHSYCWRISTLAPGATARRRIRFEIAGRSLGSRRNHASVRVHGVLAARAAATVRIGPPPACAASARPIAHAAC